MRYLLDTNVCISHLLSRGVSAISRRIADAPFAEIALCSIVKEELLFGAQRTRNPRQSAAELDVFFTAFESLPFDDESAAFSAKTRADLERRGERIEMNDVLIAAMALQHDLVLVSHNVRHFARVAGLQVEDWESLP